MRWLVTYDPATGRIGTCIGGQRAEDMADAYAELGLGVVDAPEGIHEPSNLEHYVLNGAFTERPTSPVTRTDLTLLAVPEGSTLWINGESYDAEGTVELEFPLPGTYRLRVECFPFLDWVDEVTI